MKRFIILLFFLLLTGCVKPKEKAILNVNFGDYLLVGEEMTLEVVSSYDKDSFFFKSSDDSIATVSDDGVVLGVSKGEAFIFITSKDGGNQEIIINVINDYIPENIEGSNILDEYYVEGGTYQLSAIAYPEYASQSFVWEVGGSKATINYETGEIDFLEEGDVYVLCRSALDETVFRTIKLKSVHKEDIEVIKVLFIGNSLTYRNDIPKMVKDMGRVAGKVVYTDLFSPGGNTLEINYDKYKSSLVKLLEKNEYTYVILQEASAHNFTNFQSFMEYAEKFSELVKSYGAIEVLLYQTWAYREGCVSLQNLRLTREKMQELIINAYNEVSDAIGTDINRVGEVFYNFSLDYPEIELYVDDNHSNLAGSYLSSCVHFQSIFKESVKGNKYNPGLDQETVDLIQEYVANFFE